jgi:hypothetical protein
MLCARCGLCLAGMSSGTVAPRIEMISSLSNPSDPTIHRVPLPSRSPRRVRSSPPNSGHVAASQRNDAMGHITRHRAACQAAIAYGVGSTHGAVARNEAKGPQGKWSDMLGGCWWSAIRPIEGVVEFFFEFPPLIGIVPEIPNNCYQHDADQRCHDLIERAIHDAAQYAPVRL